MQSGSSWLPEIKSKTSHFPPPSMPSPLTTMTNVSWAHPTTYMTKCAPGIYQSPSAGSLIIYLQSVENLADGMEQGFRVPKPYLNIMSIFTQNETDRRLLCRIDNEVHLDWETDNHFVNFPGTKPSSTTSRGPLESFPYLLGRRPQAHGDPFGGKRLFTWTPMDNERGMTPETALHSNSKCSFCTLPQWLSKQLWCSAMCKVHKEGSSKNTSRTKSQTSSQLTFNLCKGILWRHCLPLRAWEIIFFGFWKQQEARHQHSLTAAGSACSCNSCHPPGQELL